MLEEILLTHDRSCISYPFVPAYAIEHPMVPLQEPGFAFPTRQHVAARLLHKDFSRSECLFMISIFYLQTPVFWSGAEGIRTPDLRRAKAALSRLSYGPK
jgi:hypothetical protein